MSDERLLIKINKSASLPLVRYIYRHSITEYTITRVDHTLPYYNWMSKAKLLLEDKKEPK